TGERALVMATATADLTVEAVTNLRLGQLYATVGDYRRAIECQTRNVSALQGERLYQRFGMMVTAMASRAELCRCFAELGEFRQSLDWGNEAIRIAEASAHPPSLFPALMRVGVLYLRRGDLSAAEPMLERAVGVAEATHLPWTRLAGQAWLGNAYA